MVLQLPIESVQAFEGYVESPSPTVVVREISLDDLTQRSRAAACKPVVAVRNLVDLAEVVYWLPGEDKSTVYKSRMTIVPPWRAGSFPPIFSESRESRLSEKF